MIELTTTAKSLGERLRLYRLRKNMTLQELADLVGTSPSTISNYENDITVPDILRITAIANALDITVSMIMFGREPESEQEPLIPAENPPL